ncbi:MAG: exodeoxyribonuclease V subunit gamma, partial [Lysobacter sp.]|nr:exodeoxyribonuclease V subunit gamma [Lysobacter sp.]
MSSSPRFHLVSGNRLERLAAHLGARLAAAQDPDSLAPEVVLIPQPSLRHWLLQALAERHGVAANLDLLTPSEFVWRLLRAAHPALPETSPWEREHLRWRLYALLETLRPLPAPVRAHLQRASASGRRDALALARYELTDALADAFDKYQAYRRDWLTAWDAGKERDDWQATLWRALRAAAPDTAPRATLIGDWLMRYDRRQETRIATPPPGLPSRLFAFGTIHVSPDVLLLLAVVAQWIPLDFYLPSPSAEYWGDVESLRERLRRDGLAALPAALADADRDNPLLSAWGAGGREIVAQLFAYDMVLPEREIERYVRPPSDSLLHRLQRDVLDRAAPQPAPWREDDDSLRIHACHSRLREVEVLHDRLRAMLDNDLPEGRRFDPPLQPREIAVLAPNIADYLPLARAVFGGLDIDDPRYIPFSLADRPQAQSHPLVGLLFSLLDLADAPLRASAFHDLLALPAVARAHGLDASALERLRGWFEAAGVRWGEDEDAREHAGVGRWRDYSFAFGFDRLLAGYAAGDDAIVLGRDDNGGDGAFAPYAELEGGDAATLDAALAVHARLRGLSLWMRNAHAPAAWQQRLAAEFLALLAPEADDPDEAAARRRVLDALAVFAEEAAAAASLPAALVRRHVHDALAQPSPHQPWLSGGVTFAGMVPLRTVPFRVVCLLGMDADAYPRREPANDVNRLIDAVQGRAPRYPGDRSVRDDDRFLFLQLLCAAGDAFHLSYGGRDARDGSVREPSSLIGELLDAVETMHGADARRALTIEHPLQPFSPRAFGVDDTRRFSYRGEWKLPVTATGLVAEPTFATAPVAPADDDAETPDRDALQAFFANPAKHWLRERLGLRLPMDDAGDVDREPQGENGLLRHAAIAGLLDHDIEADDPLTSVRHLRARGVLAPGRDGDALAQAAHD